MDLRGHITSNCGVGRVDYGSYRNYHAVDQDIGGATDVKTTPNTLFSFSYMKKDEGWDRLLWQRSLQLSTVEKQLLAHCSHWQMGCYYTLFDCQLLWYCYAWDFDCLAYTFDCSFIIWGCDRHYICGIVLLIKTSIFLHLIQSYNPILLYLHNTSIYTYLTYTYMIFL